MGVNCNTLFFIVNLLILRVSASAPGTTSSPDKSDCLLGNDLTIKLHIQDAPVQNFHVSAFQRDIRYGMTKCVSEKTGDGPLIYSLTGCVENENIDVYFLDKEPVEGFINVKDKHFIIQCHIDPNGIIQTVQEQVNITDNEKNVATALPSFQIHMTIEGTESNQHQLVIGQEYHLKITGPDSYYLYPQLCKASVDGDINHGHAILYDGCSVTTDILGKFSPTNVTNKGAGTIQATMFGFRMVEAKQFYLVCSIKVCPHKGCSTSEALKDPAHCIKAGGGTVRRRRNIRKQQKRNLRNKRESKKPSNHVVKLLLNVEDEATRNIYDVSSSSSGPQGIPSVLCYVLSLIFGMKWCLWNIKAFN